ncbi:MAG: apolipoprotein N-acyltransferase [Candidatus Omnitrophica bacterium]|nr:apolipoprotein N-acyltransferase [Candidatus Omnitrophota bacterium]
MACKVLIKKRLLDLKPFKQYFFSKENRLRLIIFSALLAGLSSYSHYFSLLIWFSLSPLLITIKDSNPKENIFYSFIFAIVFFSTVLFWVGFVTIVGLFFLIFYLSFYIITFSFLAKYYLNKSTAFFTIPACWLILETLRENIWCGFGWPNLGYTQYKNLYINQVADIFGVKFISFLIIMANMFLYELLFNKKHIVKKFIILMCIFIFCFTYSLYRLNTIKEKNFLEISLVQPNHSETLKQISAKAVIGGLKNLIEKTPPNSLVILPEASWPVLIDEFRWYQLTKIIKQLKRNIILGALIKENENFYNAALYFSSNGNLVDIYRKIKLVPFGEYVPLRKYLGFIRPINDIADMERGTIRTVFDYKGKKFSVLICFEDIFPLFVSSISKNIDFLINITNDEWFFGNPQARQHLSIMCFRAIETRRPIIRAANTGISGWVAATGRIKKIVKENKEVFFKGVFFEKLPLAKASSIYVKIGEVFPLFCGIILIICIFKK